VFPQDNARAIIASMAQTNAAERREAFLTNYVTNGGNATAAYLAAGYSASPEAARRNASRLLTRADIKHALQQKQAAFTARIDYNASQWMRDALRRTQAAEDAGNWSAAMKGMELLGRRLGLFQDARSIDPREAALFAQLGAAMQAAYGSARVHAREAIVSQQGGETAQLE
jgi:hypothetical protein